MLESTALLLCQKSAGHKNRPCPLTDMGVSFVFGAVSSAIAMKAQSEAAKARLDGDLNRTKELYARIAWKKTHGMGTDEELLWELKQATQGLRDTLNNTQYVGYGKEVSSALSQLDWIDSQIWMAEQELGGNIIYTEPGSAGGSLALPFGAASDTERQQAVSQILDKVFSGRRTEKTAEAEGETESGLTLDETPDKIMPTQTIPDHILGEEGYLQQRLDYMWNGERLVIPQYTSFDKAITIAGEGTGIPIRDVDRLVEIYHRPAETWKKRAAKVTSAQYVFDIHWYESDDGVQYEVKLKNRSEIK